MAAAGGGAQEGVTRGFADAIGNTPLFRIHTLSEATGCEVLAKAEFMNPGGSIKDRAAASMIQQAEADGLLKPGGLIVEATAGNTGIGLVHIAMQKGYRCLFTCPENVSSEKIDLLRTLGAEVSVCRKCPLSEPDNFQNVAKRKAEELGGFFVNQFYNLANTKAHYKTTGPEIWKQTGGTVTGVTLATGTGGTIAGSSQYLKEQNPKIQVWMMDTPDSGVTADTRDEAGHLILRLKTKEEKEKNPGGSFMEGIGSAVLYGNLATAKIDGMFCTPCDDVAIMMTQWMLHHEGLFLGGSAALNVVSAYLLATKMGPGNVIVTVLPDGGGRYVSKTYNKDWLAERKLPSSLTAPPDLSFLDPLVDWNDNTWRK